MLLVVLPWVCAKSFGQINDWWLIIIHFDFLSAQIENRLTTMHAIFHGTRNLRLRKMRPPIAALSRWTVQEMLDIRRC